MQQFTDFQEECIHTSMSILLFVTALSNVDLEFPRLAEAREKHGDAEIKKACLELGIYMEEALEVMEGDLKSILFDNWNYYLEVVPRVASDIFRKEGDIGVADVLSIYGKMVTEIEEQTK